MGNSALLLNLFILFVDFAFNTFCAFIKKNCKCRTSAVIWIFGGYFDIVLLLLLLGKSFASQIFLSSYRLHMSTWDETMNISLTLIDEKIIHTYTTSLSLSVRQCLSPSRFLCFWVLIWRQQKKANKRVWSRSLVLWPSFAMWFKCAWLHE